MSKRKKTQSATTMEDHFYYRNSEVVFDKTDYEVSSILLELSKPVFIFSSDSPFLHKWGLKRKRSSSGLPKSPVPVMLKSPPCTDLGEIGSTSSSSCLTGEAKKTNPQTIKNGLEEEFYSNNHQKMKKNISSQPNSVRELETGLSGAQVGLLLAQPINYQGMSHLQPLICVDPTVNMRDAEPALVRRNIDLNLPVQEDCTDITTMMTFQSVESKVQAAAQARQRRLGLIRSKKYYSRFISPYQQYK